MVRIKTLNKFSLSLNTLYSIKPICIECESKQLYIITLKYVLYLRFFYLLRSFYFVDLIISQNMKFLLNITKKKKKRLALCFCSNMVPEFGVSEISVLEDSSI